MELNNEFEVNAPIDKAWVTLTDLEKIAPCMPGAQLQEIEGDEYRGIVKVKVGPITAQYKGKAMIIEKDDAAKRAVLKADGRDTRGAGNASANITAHLTDLGDRTRVTVNTDLTVTGKVAQFGRGVMADVSAKLMGQFADNLSALLEQDDTNPTSAPAEVSESEPVAEAVVEGAAAAEPAATATVVADAPATPTVRKINAPEAKPVNLLDTAGAPVAKRIVPVLGVLLLLFLLRRFLRGK